MRLFGQLPKESEVRELCGTEGAKQEDKNLLGSQSGAREGQHEDMQ